MTFHSISSHSELFLNFCFTDSISRKPHALARGVCQHLLRQTIDDPDIYVEVKDAGEVKMIWNNN